MLSCFNAKIMKTNMGEYICIIFSHLGNENNSNLRKVKGMTEARGYNLQQLQPVMLHTFANVSCRLLVLISISFLCYGLCSLCLKNRQCDSKFSCSP